MNLPSYISIQAVIMLILFGTSVSYLLGRRKTNRPFLMALVGGVLAVMPPLFVIYLVLLLLKKDLPSATATAAADLDEPKP
jgi:ABC-type molybdate transport system permease subunit